MSEVRPTPDQLLDQGRALVEMLVGFVEMYDDDPSAVSTVADAERWLEQVGRPIENGPGAAPAGAVPERINGKCVWCRDDMPVPAREQGGGRTKRFCSSACRQAHYRWTKEPERYPDAQTWTLARRGLYAKEQA